MKGQTQIFTAAFSMKQEQVLEEVTKLRQSQGGIASAARRVSEEIKECQSRIGQLGKANPDASINKIQRKLIQEVVIELITPMK